MPNHKSKKNRFLHFLEVYHIENISSKFQINRMQIDGVVSVCFMKRQNV